MGHITKNKSMFKSKLVNKDFPMLASDVNMEIS